MSWSAELFQGVLFIDPTKSGVESIELWSSISSSSPQAFQKHPIEAATSITVGAIDQRHVQLQTAPGRIDVVIGSPTMGSTPFPKIDDPDTALRLLSDLCKNLTKNVTLVRAAMVTNWFMDKPDVKSANDAFRELVPVVGEIPPNSQDLIFALNVRKVISGQELNRLCRWNSTVKQASHVSPSGFSTTIEQPALTLNVDVNTTSQNVVKPLDNAHLIYDYLEKEQHALIKGGYAALSKLD